MCCTAATHSYSCYSCVTHSRYSRYGVDIVDRYTDTRSGVTVHKQYDSHYLSPLSLLCYISIASLYICIKCSEPPQLVWRCHIYCCPGRLVVTGLSIINSHTQLRFKLLQTALHEHFLYYCLRLYLSRAVHHAACEHDTSRLPFLEVKLDWRAWAPIYTTTETVQHKQPLSCTLLFHFG